MWLVESDNQQARLFLLRTSDFINLILFLTEHYLKHFGEMKKKKTSVYISLECNDCNYDHSKKKILLTYLIVLFCQRPNKAL